MDYTCVIDKEDDSKIQSYITNLATSILTYDENSKVYIIDLKGMGSNYRALVPFDITERLNIVKDEEKLKVALSELRNHIENNSKNLGVVYVMCDDLNLNITEGTAKEFSSIILNGHTSKLYSLLVINNMDKEKWYIKFEDKLKENLKVITCSKNHITLKKGIYLNIPTDVDAITLTKKLDIIRNRIKKRERIYIKEIVPSKETFGKKDSTYGITLPIGVEKDGSKVSLTFDERKPYGLVTGDVDSGKSSLLNTIIMGVEMLYKPEDVRISAADFKNGAEFNVYKDKKSPFFDSVVSNENPYVINSFLSYHLREIDRRQMLFDKLGKSSGLLIKKYETYREVLSKETYDDIPSLPRILILIDEYQNVFDGNGKSASLLMNLIRKGRTYGIHIIMASQRAMSDDPRNGFTSELKNMFTYRIVFKSPKEASRQLLSEICSDTGRENTGIKESSLLKKGEIILNTYMGQNEKDNRRVKVYFSDNNDILKISKVVNLMYGEGNPIGIGCFNYLVEGIIMNKRIAIGTSLALLRDKYGCNDIVEDLNYISIDECDNHNMLVIGRDKVFNLSIIKSILRYSLSSNLKVNIFSKDDNKYLTYLTRTKVNNINVITQYDDIAKKLKDISCIGERYVNIFLNISDFDEFKGGFRKSDGCELLKGNLNMGKDLSIFFSDKYKTIKNDYDYVLDSTDVKVINGYEIDALNILIPGGVKDDVSIMGKSYYIDSTTNKYGEFITFV